LTLITLALVPDHMLEQQNRVVVVKVHLPARFHPALYSVPHRLGTVVQHLGNATRVAPGPPLSLGQGPGELGASSEPNTGRTKSTSTSLGLSLLQRSGGSRTHHQGTESRLSVGQDSHSSVRRQRSLLPSFALCLQSHELVQTPLLARGVSLDHSGDVTSPARDDPRAVRLDPSGTNTQNPVLALGARSYHVRSYSYRPTQNLTFSRRIQVKVRFKTAPSYS